MQKEEGMTMNGFTRRRLLTLTASLPLALALPLLARAAGTPEIVLQPVYSLTKSSLTEAFHEEMAAHIHYLAFIPKALEEKFANIAYMFSAFSTSEKIHADNYQRLLRSLDDNVITKNIKARVADTQTNMQVAADKELEKIETFYPNLIARLEDESHDEAILNCMYSWKSHRQHEAKILEIQRYSGFFFDSMADHIEDMKMDFHICEVCGSTIDEIPTSPCDICNKSMKHYKAVVRPIV